MISGLFMHLMNLRLDQKYLIDKSTSQLPIRQYLLPGEFSSASFFSSVMFLAVHNEGPPLSMSYNYQL